MQPKLERHQNPDEFAEVRRVPFAMQTQRLTKKLQAEEAATAERLKSILREATQGFVCAPPDPEWQAKAVLGFLDDFDGQEIRVADF